MECPCEQDETNTDKRESHVTDRCERTTQECETGVLMKNCESLKISTPILLFDEVKTITGAWNEFRTSNHKEIFLKGCKWSPDGTCLLTNSDDATMRLFDLPLDLYNCQYLSRTDFPELQPSLRTKIGGLVYDYTWYPLMTSTDPATCCFVTTSFSAPVQLWDAYSGELRCSYRGFNAQDELHAALSVEFSPCGGLVLCGYKDNIKIFNTDLPGRDCCSLSTKELCEQRGIVSCFAVNPCMPNVFVAGSYSKTVGMYSTDGHAMCLLAGQSGGLTQLKFSYDGVRLYAAGRKDPEILCWDLRNLGQILYVLQRPHCTNQRIYFDISTDNRYLLSGSSDGNVRVWDLQSVLQTGTVTSGENVVLPPLLHWRAHNDCVNGLSVHRHIPVVATASGQRYIPGLVEGEDDVVFALERPPDKYEDSVKLWWTGPIQVHLLKGLLGVTEKVHVPASSIDFCDEGVYKQKCNYVSQADDKIRVVEADMTSVIDYFHNRESTAFAHCISADTHTERNMSEGVALLIRKYCGRPSPSNLIQTNLAYQKEEGKSPVYSLITKKKFFHKPTTKSYDEAFYSLTQDFRSRNLNRLVCSPMGCTRDRIELEHFAANIKQFQEYTGAHIEIIVHDEQSHRELRRGLSYTEFVRRLRQLVHLDQPMTTNDDQIQTDDSPLIQPQQTDDSSLDLVEHVDDSLSGTFHNSSVSVLSDVRAIL